MRAVSKGPIVLLADSQLLFARESNEWFRSRIEKHVANHSGPGVYIGASNNNEEAFFDMGREALKDFGVYQTHFLKSSLLDLGVEQNETPSVILLSGGDVSLGWKLLNQPDIASWVLNAHSNGCLLLGISAGAIHLTNGVAENVEINPISFFNLYPTITLVHEENDGWPSEQLYLGSYSKDMACLRIPFGGGAWIDTNKLIAFGKHPPTMIVGLDTIVLPFEV